MKNYKGTKWLLLSLIALKIQFNNAIITETQEFHNDIADSIPNQISHIFQFTREDYVCRNVAWNWFINYAVVYHIFIQIKVNYSI